jgi:hypothetical protein
MPKATRVHSTPQTSASAIEVRCSYAVWKMLGWRGPDAHPLEFSDDLADDRITSLVLTPWAYDRQPLKFRLACGPSPTRP